MQNFSSKSVLNEVFIRILSILTGSQKSQLSYNAHEPQKT